MGEAFCTVCIPYTAWCPVYISEMLSLDYYLCHTKTWSAFLLMTVLPFWSKKKVPCCKYLVSPGSQPRSTSFQVLFDSQNDPIGIIQIHDKVSV
jgi:hypothetical protein